MADQIQTGGGGHGGLHFIAGALVIVVGIGAFFALGGRIDTGKSGPEVKIEAPKTPASKTQ